MTSTSTPRETAPIAPNATGLDRIDPHSDAALAEWAKRLDVTPEQLKEAIEQVGDRATDVELHLKGSRSTSNEKLASEAPDAAGSPENALEQADDERKAAERPLKNA
jgi:hypothetical protein